MRAKFLFFIMFTILTVNCSSSAKKSPDIPAPSPVPATPAAPAQPAAPDSSSADKSSLTCSLGEIKRSIAIDAPGPKGCKLMYSNFSDKDPVAWSFKALTHCEKVRDNIRGNLEKAGFACSAG